MQVPPVAMTYEKTMDSMQRRVEVPVDHFSLEHAREVVRWIENASHEIRPARRWNWLQEVSPMDEKRGELIELASRMAYNPTYLFFLICAGEPS